MKLILLPLSMSLALLVMLVNMYLTGESSISSVDYLRYDLTGLTPEQADAGWIDRWLWTDEAPYKYRILGRLPLGPATGLFELFAADRDQAFYLAFISWSFLLLWGFLYLLARYTEKFLRATCSELRDAPAISLSAAAMLLAALVPPLLFLFKYPVHGTPNDILGYLLMVAALTNLLERRVLACSLIASLAVTCRETTLLVPFVLLFVADLPLRRRLLAAGLPVIVLLLYRLLWPGSYDPSTGAQVNFTMPVESAGFLLMVFGPLWLLGTFGWFSLRGDPVPWSRPLERSFPWAVLLVLTVVLMTARLREIRIIYILFLYFVPFSMMFLYRFGNSLKDLLRHRLFALYLLCIAVVTFRLWTLVMPEDAAGHAWLWNRLGVIYSGYPATPQYNWLGIMFTQLVLLLVCAPFALPLMRRDRA